MLAGKKIKQQQQQQKVHKGGQINSETVPMKLENIYKAWTQLLSMILTHDKLFFGRAFAWFSLWVEFTGFVYTGVWIPCQWLNTKKPGIISRLPLSLAQTSRPDSDGLIQNDTNF